MLQLILYRSFIPCIGLPLLTSICCVLLDLVRGIASLRNIFSVVALEILSRVIADAIVMFFYDVGSQPILHLSYNNASSFKDPLLLNILVILRVQIVCALLML